MADQTELAALADRLRAATAAFVALRPQVEAGQPYALSDHFGVEPEARWGPPETLAHVSEMIPFWTGEMERVLAGSPDPVPFGRVAGDGLRVGIIGRDRSLPAGELFSRIESDAARLAARLDALDPGAAARLGLHPTLGEVSVPRLVERFVVGHLEEHVEQLRDVVRAGNSPD